MGQWHKKIGFCADITSIYDKCYNVNIKYVAYSTIKLKINQINAKSPD